VTTRAEKKGKLSLVKIGGLGGERGGGGGKGGLKAAEEDT